MGMSMGMSLSLSTAQSIELTQTQALVQGVSLGMTQELAQLIQLSRSGGGPVDPKENLTNVFRLIAEALTDPKLRAAVESLTAIPQLSARLIDARKELAAPSLKLMHQFGVDFVFYTSSDRGKFTSATGENGQFLPNPPTTQAIHFSDAYFKPREFNQRTETLKQALQGAAESVRSVAEYSEHIDAINVVEAMRKQIDSVCLIMEVLFQKKDPLSNESLLQTFLRDYVILENLDLLLSERLLKRFVKRFHTIGVRSAWNDFEEQMLNTIAEFTLISMGIISPSIFSLQKGQVDEEVYEAAREELAKYGINLDAKMRYYGLKITGNLFWYRYSTRNVRCSNVTEDIVRSFITQTVRADRKQIFEIVNFPELFEKLQQIKLKAPSPQDFAEESIAELSDVLSGPQFQEHYTGLLRKWYPKLATLL